MRLRTWALASALLLLPVPVGAQATGTGTVIGRVTDSSAAVLPGVTVTFKSPEAMGQYTAVTDAQGAYRIVNLPPASYEARAELQGFQSAVQQVMGRIGDQAQRQPMVGRPMLSRAVPRRGVIG